MRRNYPHSPSFSEITPIVRQAFVYFVRSAPARRAPSILTPTKIYIPAKSSPPRKSLLPRTIAALTQLSVPIDGTEYTNWDTCRKAISDWSVLAKFSFVTPIKNKDRATYACVVDDCTWKYYARRGKNSIIRFCITNNKYICDGVAESKRKISSIKEFLDEIMPQFLRVSEKTTA